MMNKELIEIFFKKQQRIQPVPSNIVVADWATKLICILYPELSQFAFLTTAEIEAALKKLQKELVSIMNATKACYNCNNEEISQKFFNNLTELYRKLNTDIEAINTGDPAAQNEFEVIRTYPGFYALCFYRIAHVLYTMEVPLLPRILTEFAHSKTGIDIHPGAQIGDYLMIDHGTGTVIGETSIIGEHVKIYQGVTLGALSIKKNMANQKRHPTLLDGVVIYANATILGGDTIIGEGSVIGGNVWLTHSVAPGSLVYHSPDITVEEGKFKNNK